MTLAELRQKRDELRVQMAEIGTALRVERRAVTCEERDRFEGLKAEWQSILDEIERVQGRTARSVNSRG
jgi:hypothetical protein